MTRSRASLVALVVAVTVVTGAPAWAQPAPSAAPAGQMTWASHVALAPTWFDPAETSGIITPFAERQRLVDKPAFDAMERRYAGDAG